MVPGVGYNILWTPDPSWLEILLRTHDRTTFLDKEAECRVLHNIVYKS